jgi:hypothetical protein
MDQSLSFSKLKFKELTGRDPAISKKVIRNLEETMSHKQIYSFESFEIWITSYFAKIRKSKWLTGDEFQLHLSWVLDLANVIKIESGAYDNFRKKSPSIDAACGYIAQKKGTANYDDDQDPWLQDPWDNYVDPVKRIVAEQRIKRLLAEKNEVVNEITNAGTPYKDPLDDL